MKRLKDQLSLEGTIEQISMTELRKRPREVIDSVILGKVFLVSKQGNIIAVIQSPPANLLTVIDRHGNKSYSL